MVPPEKYFKEHPDATSIDVSQNYSENPCQCDICMAVVKEEGSQHGTIMRFVNAIVDAVAEKYPNKMVDTLAYAYSTKPSAITKPHKPEWWKNDMLQEPLRHGSGHDGAESFITHEFIYALVHK